MKKILPYKKILVTGGAGFIGSNFIRHLYEDYPDSAIYNYDLLTYAGNLENLRDISSQEKKKKFSERRYFFIKGDIGDEQFLDKLFKKHKFDIVVNFAAESHVDRSIVSSQNFIKVNVLGVHVLIDLAKKYNIKRFVHISTDEIYGDVASGQSSEGSHLKPSNPYAASKAGADFLVQSYMRTHRLPGIILRGSNNYGCFQYPEKLIPLTITNLLEGKAVPLHGNGRHVRKWLHVEDFCSAIALAMYKAKDFSIYNVAGVPKKNREIVQEICAILGKPFKASVKTVSDRPGADFRYSPASHKIERELGWRAQKHINLDLKAVVDWYVQNQAWWKRIKKKREFLDHYQKQSRALYY